MTSFYQLSEMARRVDEARKRGLVIGQDNSGVVVRVDASIRPAYVDGTIIYRCPDVESALTFCDGVYWAEFGQQGVVK